MLEIRITAKKTEPALKEAIRSILGKYNCFARPEQIKSIEFKGQEGLVIIKVDEPSEEN